jgi:hypothetical protein
VLSGMVIVATRITPSAPCSTLFPPLRCIIFSGRESARGHGLPWRPSAGAAGPPQKAAAPAGDRRFRVCQIRSLDVPLNDVCPA